MALHRVWTNWRRSLAFGFLFWISAAVAAEAQQIQVTSANPPAAAQGTVNLNVSIKGKGFKKGAIAKFVLSGTDDPDGIAVNSSTFVSSTELTANITVAETATIAKFDIAVKNNDGRIGKGTELFSVLEKGKPASTGGLLGTCATFRDLATDHLTSDGQALYCDPKDGQVTIGGIKRDVGRFRLDTTKYTNTRLAGLDFTGPVTGSGISGTLTTEVVYQSGGWYDVPGLEPCTSGTGLEAVGEGIALNFNSIPLGKTCYAALVVTFTPPGDTTHRVAFGNETDPIVPCFGGSPVAVKCTAAKSDGSCSAWTMEGTQACVVRGFGKEKVDLGLWDMAFSVNIALEQ